MKGCVALLGFSIVAGIVSLASGGFPHEGCATDFKWSQVGEYCYYVISTSDGGKPAQKMSKICAFEGPYVMGSTPIEYLADVQSQAEQDFIAQEVSGGNRTWVKIFLSGESWKWNGHEEPALASTNWKPN
ncbi:hypothetical protein HOLleu_30761 [Holothuria leucospilota]|uniref:C-type lectin domain-containing protein n=1 Tax=Holothuria leucospilota TaxID=206669 RepID=A0A9Q1BL24_HOLLE|nr:hypothetical protein HOLleu_30761 [Holothuria leucospilota]